MSAIHPMSFATSSDQLAPDRIAYPILEAAGELRESRLLEGDAKPGTD